MSSDSLLGFFPLGPFAVLSEIAAASTPQLRSAQLSRLPDGCSWSLRNPPWLGPWLRGPCVFQTLCLDRPEGKFLKQAPCSALHPRQSSEQPVCLSLEPLSAREFGEGPCTEWACPGVIRRALLAAWGHLTVGPPRTLRLPFCCS